MIKTYDRLSVLRAGFLGQSRLFWVISRVHFRFHIIRFITRATAGGS